MNSFKIQFKVILLWLLINTFLLNDRSLAQCTSTTAHSGSTFVSDGSLFNDFPFASPGNAAASDNNRATAAAVLTLLVGNTEYLKATGFGFSIPISATICGILVEVEKSATSIGALAWIVDNSTRLVKNGSIMGNNYSSSIHWTSSDAYYSYGGTSDLWGTTWLPSDINSPTFGAAISAGIVGVLGLLPVARIDHIRITVSYFDVPLAVSLLNFKVATQSDHSATLQWTTTGGGDGADLYNIQRSIDGIDWTTIHSIHCEASHSDMIYQYTDAYEKNDAAYYRLNIQYANGHSIFSRQVKVTWSDQSFALYPNPATNTVFIRQKENVRSLICTAIDGRVYSVNFQQTGNDLYQVNISTLPPGAYTLLLNTRRKLFVKGR